MLGVERGEGFVEFFSKSGVAELGLRGREAVEVFDEPVGASGGKGAVDGGFRGESFGGEDDGFSGGFGGGFGVFGGDFGKGFLVVNWAGVHDGGKFHDRDGEGFVAV